MIREGTDMIRTEKQTGENTETSTVGMKTKRGDMMTDTAKTEKKRNTIGKLERCKHQAIQHVEWDLTPSVYDIDIIRIIVIYYVWTG